MSLHRQTPETTERTDTIEVNARAKGPSDPDVGTGDNPTLKDPTSPSIADLNANANSAGIICCLREADTGQTLVNQAGVARSGQDTNGADGSQNHAGGDNNGRPRTVSSFLETMADASQTLDDDGGITSAEGDSEAERDSLAMSDEGRPRDWAPARRSRTSERDSQSAPVMLGGVSVPGYDLLQELGRGGMGVVYKARDRRLNRLVALKMILGGAHVGPAGLARFRAEAEAVAELHHANIVQIYETGEHDGCPYLSLEFVDGGSLEEQMASESDYSAGRRRIGGNASARHRLRAPARDRAPRPQAGEYPAGEAE